jgi:hypothetical protein
LESLKANKLFAKQSKCSFGTTTVTYLGHVISAEGVAMDSAKVEAVTSRPQAPRGLRGFLGLAGYYRKFIKGFGVIVAPLTKLLKKEGFQWSPEANKAFEALKRALSIAPVLQLPNFANSFIVDCDASGSGFGIVLHQDEGPIAFSSRPFAARHVKLAAYERELIGLVHSVHHWRPYLWGSKFVVRTDHFSLKYMLDQRLSTVPQHQWISKLFGFDFKVEYRAGRLNTVADALSRRETTSGSVYTISTPTFQLYKDLQQDCASNQEFQLLHNQISTGQQGAPWQIREGLIMHGNQIFVPQSSSILPAILHTAHSAGHGGIQKTLQRLRTDFFVHRDRALVRDWVRSCAVCQQNKTETLHPAGLLQPLEVPAQIWSDISMDFIEALPKVYGKSVILTVVDRFSKYAHFIPLSHPYTAATVARAFFDEIVRLHGFPSSIVSDRDPVFTGHIWRDLFKLAGVKLRMSTAFHPQTDGQSEVVNKTIAMYLRCITGDRPRAWVDWIAWAEYCYNTSYHLALKTTPFKVVYDRDPPPLIPYQQGAAATPTIEEMFHERDCFLAEVGDRLLQGQEHARRFYDGHHQDLEFKVGACYTDRHSHWSADQKGN